jgi:thymidylate synthase
MPVHERELAQRANAELLRQIEESLVHSRDIIAQVNEVIAQINELRAQRRARVGSWRLTGLNLSRKLDSEWVN